MNRTTSREDGSKERKIDWALWGERSLFWGILLIVGATFHSAFAFTTTSAPIPTAGIIRQTTPMAPPSVEHETLARVVEIPSPAATPCICTDVRSSR